jgi:hypothetical protein
LGLYTGDVGGEEVDAVSVEVAACAVVVFGGAWSASDLMAHRGMQESPRTNKPQEED